MRQPNGSGALRALVASVGSGPWGAGLWWGDSQISLLAAWIGQAVATREWAAVARGHHEVVTALIVARATVELTKWMDQW